MTKYIFWPFLKSVEFILDGKTQLTKGLVMEAKPGNTQVNIWVEKNHYQITHKWDMVNVKITRKKKLIEISINDTWKQTYYLKTPIIWKTRPK